MKSLVFGVLASLFSLNALAIDCHGTEPFWAAEVADDKVVLEGPGYEPALTLPVTNVSGAAGYTASFLQVFSNNNGQVAMVTSNECNNGMSDHIFPNEVYIFTGSTTLYGCCGEGVIVGPGN